MGKWWDERPGGKIDDPSYPNRGGNPDLYWKTQTDNSLAASPHGGFTDSTNLCKICHAVHGGRPDGYRLLRNSSRETECWFCHEGAGSASSIWVYQLEDFGVTVRGEHRVADLKPPSVNGGGPNTFDDTSGPNNDAREDPTGYKLHDASDSIPDSTVNGGTESGDDFTGYLRNGRYPVIDVGGVRKLYCGTCHSVHGSDIITFASLAPSILRDDPAGNDTGTENITTQDIAAIDDPTQAGYQPWGDAAYGNSSVKGPLANRIIWAFCGDCHNANVNWTAANDVRPNKMTHPGNTNGAMEVYGKTPGPGEKNVSWINATQCTSCHSAPHDYEITLHKDTDLGSTETFTVTSDPDDLGILGNVRTVEGDLTNGLPVSSTFSIELAGYPHQSVSDKFLRDQPVGTNPPLTNGPAKVDNPDPYRSVPNMDRQCLECHWDTGDATATQGVGKTF